MLNFCRSVLSALSLCDEVQILIDISIDGANVYESVNFDIWPIQYRIVNIKDKSQIAGIYAGPRNLPILQISLKIQCRTIATTRKKVISFNDKIVRKLNFFIADILARYARLNIKGHAGFNSRNKCKILGEGHKTDRTTIFRGSSFAD